MPYCLQHCGKSQQLWWTARGLYKNEPKYKHSQRGTGLMGHEPSTGTNGNLGLLEEVSCLQ